jgi:hypothetical protein
MTKRPRRKPPRQISLVRKNLIFLLISLARNRDEVGRAVVCRDILDGRDDCFAIRIVIPGLIAKSQTIIVSLSKRAV